MGRLAVDGAWRMAAAVAGVAVVAALGVAVAGPGREAAPAAQPPGSVGVRTDLSGGARGEVTWTNREETQPVAGIMVQLISHQTAIRTTVYTDEVGRYEFPVLPAGNYVLRIARPLHFFPYQRDTVRIDGATSLPEIHLERRSQSEFLPPDPDLLTQLTGAEWLFNAQGTHYEKQLFVNSCTSGCHGGDRPFNRRFDERGWRLIVGRMTNYNQRILVSSSGRPPDSLTRNAETIYNFLVRNRAIGVETPPIVPFDRPKGLATRAVITEYELPWAMVNIHDVSGDEYGNIWFNVNRSPFIGRLDPETGQITQFRLPEGPPPAENDPQDRFYPPDGHPREQYPPGVHPGTHWIEWDENTDRLWFTHAWARTVGVLDPSTGDVRYVFTGGQGNHTLSPDGLSIWRTHQNKIMRWDTRTMMDAPNGIARPDQTFDLHRTRDTYGNFVSPDGKYFGGGSGNWIVWLDIATGEVRERPVEVGGSRGRGSFGPDGSLWSGSRKLTRYDPSTDVVTQYDPPTPYFHAYSTKVDKNGEVWSGQQSNGRVFRFNPALNRWIEYVMPSPWSHDFSSWIDNSTDPPVFWYGDQHGYLVRIQPIE